MGGGGGACHKIRLGLSRQRCYRSGRCELKIYFPFTAASKFPVKRRVVRSEVYRVEMSYFCILAESLRCRFLLMFFTAVLSCSRLLLRVGAVYKRSYQPNVYPSRYEGLSSVHLQFRVVCTLAYASFEHGGFRRFHDRVPISKLRIAINPRLVLRCAQFLPQYGLR